MSHLDKASPLLKKAQPLVIFLAGIFAFGWQVLAEDSDRPYLLAVIAGMLGLPFVRLADKLRNLKDGEDEEDAKSS